MSQPLSKPDPNHCKPVFHGIRATAVAAFASSTMLALAACSGTPATSAQNFHPSAPAKAPITAGSAANATPDATQQASLRLPPPRTLKGLKPEEVVDLMGPPDFRRVDPPAQFWQYRTTDCILDVFFYHEDDGYRVSVAGTRNRAAGSGGAARCVVNRSVSGKSSPQSPL